MKNQLKLFQRSNTNIRENKSKINIIVKMNYIFAKHDPGRRRRTLNPNIGSCMSNPNFMTDNEEMYTYNERIQSQQLANKLASPGKQRYCLYYSL